MTENETQDQSPEKIFFKNLRKLEENVALGYEHRKSLLDSNDPRDRISGRLMEIGHSQATLERLPEARLKDKLLVKLQYILTSFSAKNFYSFSQEQVNGLIDRGHKQGQNENRATSWTDKKTPEIWWEKRGSKK